MTAIAMDQAPTGRPGSYVGPYGLVHSESRAVVEAARQAALEQERRDHRIKLGLAQALGLGTNQRIQEASIHGIEGSEGKLLIHIRVGEVGVSANVLQEYLIDQSEEYDDSLVADLRAVAAEVRAVQPDVAA